MNPILKKILIKFGRIPPNSIVLFTQGGLGNRLPALSSALELSYRLNKRLVVYWTVQNTGLNARFESLFEINHPHQITFVKTYSYRKIKQVMAWFFKLRLGILDKIITSDRPMEDTNSWHKFNTIAITTYRPLFYKAKFANLSYLKPIQSIQDEIDVIKKTFDKEHLVGIHIRRGDTINQRRNAKIITLIKYMRQEVKNDSQVQFFVASDSQAEKDRLKTVFDNKIVSYDGHNSRTSELGVQTAIVDLYLLGATKKIIGTIGSTFAIQASLIEGATLYFIENDNLCKYNRFGTFSLNFKK